MLVLHLLLAALPYTMAACRSWCNVYICGMHDVCGSCTSCITLAESRYCAGWCNSYTAGFAYCQGCGTPGTPKTCPDLGAGDEFALSLTDLQTVGEPATYLTDAEAVASGYHVPTAFCFNNVTLDFLLASGHRKYAWVPPTMTSGDALEAAPDGMYAYRMANPAAPPGGTLLYKAVHQVPLGTPNALLFGMARPVPQFHSFQEAAAYNGDDPTTKAMADAITRGNICNGAPGSVDGHHLAITPLGVDGLEPKTNDIDGFAWATGPFALPGTQCGSFMYEGTGADKKQYMYYQAC